MNGTPLALRMGFWDRLQDRLQAVVSDPARMARYYQLAYYVSTAVVVLGVALALLIYSGAWTP